MRLDQAGVVSQLIKKTLAKQDLVVPQTAQDKYYLTYITDVVYGLVKLIFAPEKQVKQGIFYFVNPQEVNLLDVANVLSELSPSPLKVSLSPPAKNVPLIGSPKIDLSRSKRDLYWEAKVGYTEGLKRTLEYFQKHPPKFLQEEEKEKKEPSPEPAAAYRPKTGSLTESQRNAVKYEVAQEEIKSRLEQKAIPPEDEKLSLPPSSLKQKIAFRLKSLVGRPEVRTVGEETARVGGWLSLKHQEEKPPFEEKEPQKKEDFQKVAGVEARRRKLNWKKFIACVSFGLVSVYFVFLPLGLSSFFTFQGYRSLQSAKASILSGNPKSASRQFLILQKDIQRVGRQLNNLGWLCRLLGQDKRCQAAGKLLTTADFLAEGAYFGSQALEEGQNLLQTVQSVSPPLGGAETGGNIAEKIKNYVSQMVINVNLAKKRFSLANVEAQKIDSRQFPFGLSRRLEDGLQVLDCSDKEIANIEIFLSKLPLLLGIPQKQTIMILLQNNNELRATGGFIGSYVLATFNSGVLEEIKVDDIYNPDGQLKITETAPQPLRDYLEVDQLGIRDANWWPDFPASAQKIAALFKQATNREVTTIIGLNLLSVQSLLAEVGPLTLDDYQETIDAGNLFERAEYHAEVGFTPGSDQKRNFLTSLSQELIDRILVLEGSSYLKAARSLLSGLSSREILLYSSNPSLQSLFANLDYEGSMPLTPGDFISVIDSNVGGNKANYWVKRSSRYRLDVDRDGNLIGVLTVRWNHSGTSGTWPGGDYRNYLRVYVPLGSGLLESEGFSSEVVEYDEFGRRVFGGLVKVPVNSSKEVELKYYLPREIGFAAQTVYQLGILKQPGIADEPFKLTINLPVFLKPKRVSSGSIDKTQTKITWETTLTNNQEFELEVGR